MTSVTQHDLIHLGLDVHKNSISVGMLGPDDEVPHTEKVSSDDNALASVTSSP
jgi:hypothetical protein